MGDKKVIPLAACLCNAAIVIAVVPFHPERCSANTRNTAYIFCTWNKSMENGTFYGSQTILECQKVNLAER